MNERIKKLIEQASYNIIETDGAPIISREFNKEKFAELIIKECILMCETQEYHYWCSPEDQEFTPIDCADAIKEHFGVE